MKTIGLLGGMSWESTSSYYQLINQQVKQRLGGLHSAKICMYSVDFHEIEQRQHQGDWQSCGDILADAAKKIEGAGADFIVICTNTMHKIAPSIEQNIGIPLLHIADATGEQLKQQNIQCVGLLGTRFTMEQDFYKNRLLERYSISTIIPSISDIEFIHHSIYHELCQGIINNHTREKFITIINKLHTQGIEALILGCTEISLLIQQRHTRIKLFDTTSIHAQKAAEEALK